LSGDYAGKDAMNPQPQLRILLVEGIGADALTVQRALAQCFGGDFALTHVERLEDTFNRIEAQKFDVVLLDLMLPDSSGLDTFLRLRRHEPRLPVLVLTGPEDEGAGIKAMQEGAQDYLFKNQIEPAILARAVRSAIERHQIAAELRESEERLRIVTDTANVGLAAVDREHRYRYANRAWAEFLELPIDDLVGQRMADRLGALYDDQIRRRLELAFWGERASHELVISPSSPGREKRFFTVSYEPRANLLEPIVVVIIVDVTERRQAHEALLARHQQLQTLHAISEEVFTSTNLNAVVELILDKALSLGSFELGVVRLRDPEGNLFRAVALKGYLDPEVAINRNIDLQNPATGMLNSHVVITKESIIVEDVPTSQGLADFKKEEVQSAILVPIIAAQEVLGTIQLGSRTPRKFPPELLRTLEALGNHVGIAIQKARLHQETQRSLERIRALHEVNTAITTTLDVQGILNILLEKLERFVPIVSVSTVRLLKPASGALNSLACRGVDRDDWMLRQERGPITGRARQVVERGAPVVIRNIESAPSAESRGFFRKYGLVSYLGVPLIAHNEIVGVLGLYTRHEHDFSRAEIDFVNTMAGQGAVAIHNAQLFEQINGQARDLERANKVRDDFLSVISHELRSPLNITMGYVGMMKDGLLGAITPEQKEALQKVLNHSVDQLRMVEEMLATTDLEARKIFVDRQRVDVSDILRQLQSDFDMIHDKNQPELIWDYPEERVPIATDGRKLRQVVQNLVANALKFTDQGKITVSAKTVSGSRERISIPDEREQECRSQSLEIKVSDTGLGIASDKLDAIFEKFHQVDASATRSHGGLGLGLYIAKQFTELLGGKIELQSELGQGSTFTVTIPFGT
jgi:PAS domain S-box-containing protein